MPDYISIREASGKYLPGRPHVNTARRWMQDGVNGVRLRSVLFGGKRFTTAQWCQEFVEAVTSRAEQSSEHHVAEAQLDGLGV